MIVELFEEAFSGHDTPYHFTDIVLTVGKEDLRLTIWLIVFEHATINIAILSRQFALAFPGIEMKLSLIACIFLGVLARVVLNEALSMHFAFEEGPLVNFTIRPLLDTVA